MKFLARFFVTFPTFVFSLHHPDLKCFTWVCSHIHSSLAGSLFVDVIEHNLQENSDLKSWIQDTWANTMSLDGQQYLHSSSRSVLWPTQKKIPVPPNSWATNRKLKLTRYQSICFFPLPVKKTAQVGMCWERRANVKPLAKSSHDPRKKK
jgi:hypothetical protein